MPANKIRLNNLYGSQVDGVKRGEFNAFKFLNLILVNHLTSRWFEVEFNLARPSNPRAKRERRHLAARDGDERRRRRRRRCGSGPFRIPLHNSFNYYSTRFRDCFRCFAGIIPPKSWFRAKGLGTRTEATANRVLKF